MAKTNRKKKLEKRKNYNPPGKKLGSRGGSVYGWEQLMQGEYPEESVWLQEQMYDLIDEVDDYCHDNFRFCLVSNDDALKQYEEKAANGCCGFANKEVTHPKSKNVYQIGFNYGH